MTPASLNMSKYCAMTVLAVLLALSIADLAISLQSFNAKVIELKYDYGTAHPAQIYSETKSALLKIDNAGIFDNLLLTSHGGNILSSFVELATITFSMIALFKFDYYSVASEKNHALLSTILGLSVLKLVLSNIGAFYTNSYFVGHYKNTIPAFFSYSYASSSDILQLIFMTFLFGWALNLYRQAISQATN